MLCVFKIFDKNGKKLCVQIAQAAEEALVVARQKGYSEAGAVKFVRSQPSY